MDRLRSILIKYCDRIFWHVDETNEDASKNISRFLNEYKQNGDDTLVLYFCGHGYLTADNSDLLLSTTDTMKNVDELSKERYTGGSSTVDYVTGAISKNNLDNLTVWKTAQLPDIELRTWKEIVNVFLAADLYIRRRCRCAPPSGCHPALRIPRMISLIWSEGRSASSSTVTSRMCSVIWVGETAAVFGELGESSSNWTDSCRNNTLLIFRCQL